MNKGFKRSSQFLFLSLIAADVISLNVEADEAFITVMNTNDNTLQVRRERNRNFAKEKAKAENAGLANDSNQIKEWESIAFAGGTVPLDVMPSYSGAISNAPITNTSGNTQVVERRRNESVGLKEIIDFKPTNVTYPLNVCIELVQYIPVEMVQA